MTAHLTAAALDALTDEQITHAAIAHAERAGLDLDAWLRMERVRANVKAVVAGTEEE